jgi:hypothetical protein
MLVWMPSFSMPPSLALAAPHCLPALYLAAERERLRGRAELQLPLSLPMLQATTVVTKCTTTFASSFPTSCTRLHGPSITGALPLAYRRHDRRPSSAATAVPSLHPPLCSTACTDTSTSSSSTTSAPRLSQSPPELPGRRRQCRRCRLLWWPRHHGPPRAKLLAPANPLALCSTIGAPPPPARPPPSYLLMWPGGHGPPPVVIRPPTGAGGHAGARAALPHHQHGPHRSAGETTAASPISGNRK